MELKYYVDKVEVTEEEFKTVYYEEEVKRQTEWVKKGFGTDIKGRVERNMHEFFEIHIPHYLEIQGFVGRQYCTKDAKFFEVRLVNEKVIEVKCEEVVKQLRKARGLK